MAPLSIVWSAVNADPEVYLGVLHVHSVLKSPLQDLTADQVRIAFLVQLPFRFRVTDLVRFQREEDGIELCLRNRFPIPEGTDLMQTVVDGGGDWTGLIERLSTDALLIFDEVDVSAESLADLRRGGTGSINFTPAMFRAVQFLNEFTVAYLSSGYGDWGTSSPRLLQFMQFADRERYSITLLAEKGSRLSNEEVEPLFSLSLSARNQSFGFGPVHDLPWQAFAFIHDAFDAQRNHVYYEFAVRSQAALDQGEHQVALLLGCVALEAAHAAFLQGAMSRLMKGKDPARDELVGNLLREQGFHTLFRVSPLLFLGPTEQPPPELVEQCKKAVEMRNDIMHAKSKRGRYKLRQHSTVDVLKAHGAVMKLAQYFAAAVDRQILRDRRGEESADEISRRGNSE